MASVNKRATLAVGVIFTIIGFLLGLSAIQGNLASIQAAKGAVVLVTEDVAPSCINGSVDQVRQEVKDHELDSVEYSGDKAKKVVAAAIEVLGPPPDPAYAEADVLIAVALEEVNIVAVGFFKDGCYLGKATLQPRMWNAILEKAYGRSAGV